MSCASGYVRNSQGALHETQVPKRHVQALGSHPSKRKRPGKFVAFFFPFCSTMRGHGMHGNQRGHVSPILRDRGVRSWHHPRPRRQTSLHTRIMIVIANPPKRPLSFERGISVPLAKRSNTVNRQEKYVVASYDPVSWNQGFHSSRGSIAV